MNRFWAKLKNLSDTKNVQRVVLWVYSELSWKTKQKITFIFYPLIACYHINFWKNLMNRFCRNFCTFAFSSFTRYWAKYELFLKILNSDFYPLFNACHQVQFEKNLMNRFKERLKSVNFGPKSDPFTSFSAY